MLSYLNLPIFDAPEVAIVLINVSTEVEMDLVINDDFRCKVAITPIFLAKW